MDLGGVKEVKAIALSDQDIKDYLPNALILKYSELSKYPTLHDLLPEVKSYCILLYEDSMNHGHWTVVSRPSEGIAEFYCSYGSPVDSPLKWTPKPTRVGLGVGKQYLSLMFRDCPEEVVYNKIKYQKDGQHINDCGRFVILRTLKMLKGLDLDQFYAFMNAERRRLRLDYDGVASILVP